MKNYEVLTDVFGDKIIKTTNGNKQTFIPLDPANSDYAEYLRYAAWVEAGNDPDEFWTRTEEI